MNVFSKYVKWNIACCIKLLKYPVRILFPKYSVHKQIQINNL